MACEPYILICAGEDSGDSVGEPLVKSLVSKNFTVKGSGGRRMQAAGMLPLVDFENLPVSGFGDVLPKYFKLRQCYNELKSSLESPECLGLVAIDYPGFNMKLVALAGKLHKPALYVAPPQVWAWKRKRAKVLARNPYVKLAVFFDFEERVYADAGCNVVRVMHPFIDKNEELKIKNSETDVGRDVSLRGNAVTEAISSQSCLLLPGSRKSQALRNLPVYLNAIANLNRPPESVTIACARRELVAPIQEFVSVFCNSHHLKNLANVQVVEVPSEISARRESFGGYSLALACPGTVTLELALSGCPMVVCTKPDMLTYCLGRIFIKTKFFALPNIILNEQVYPEYILGPFQGYPRLNRDFWGKDRRHDIYAKLSVGQTLEQLATEFLRQFVEGKAE
jgi:lipid-A-disaccharide synthase